MDAQGSKTVKNREVVFNEFHPDGDQAATAAAVLQDLPGILGTEPLSAVCLQIRYDICLVSLQIIDEMLSAAGLHLDNGLLNRLKRALYYYTEETERANMGCPRGSANCTQRVFINRYERLEHGCRDHRPDHWRRYL